MNLVVFGASGATGHRLVRQALMRDHAVRAFVRDPRKLTLQDSRLSTIQGEVTDCSAVARAVEGQAAVICSLGARSPLRPYPAFTEGIQQLVRAMRSTGVSRFVYLSFLGVRAGRRQLRFPFRQLVPLLLPGAIADHESNEREIRQSGLAWTIVRPPKLTEGPPTGNYRVGEEIHATSRFPALARADVAAFMLDQLSSTEFVGRAPAIVP